MIVHFCFLFFETETKENFIAKQEYRVKLDQNI